jgi:hypothetical protein
VAEAREVWRPRLWVRCVASAAPLLLASTLLYPQILNPDWTNGTPREELPWLAALIIVASVMAYAALVSRIVIDQPTLRIVNPWGSRTLRADDVIAVEPGSFGVQFLTSDGRRQVALAVQCRSVVPGRRQRWVDVAVSVTGNAPRPEPPVQLAQLAAQVERYGEIRGYGVQSLGADDGGYLVFLMSIPGRDGEAKLSFNGEVFLLDLPGGYTWPEFGYTDEEAQEAFRDQLALLSAYADPATKEVEVKRRLRRARLELHVSNGAVLRRHGWSKGPDPVER